MTTAQVKFDVELWDRQMQAFESPATEILFGGASEGGKSHFVRVALCVWCLSIPNLQCLLIRKKYDDILRNHLYGPNGFNNLLRDFIACGVKITQSDIRFPNGSVISFQHCFTGDTEILTDKGRRTFKSLLNESGYVSIAPGIKAPFRNVRKTRINAEILELTFDDGSKIKCTPDHRFVTSDGVIEARDLLDKKCLTNEFPLSVTQSKFLEKKSILFSQNKNTLVEVLTGYIELFGNSTKGIYQLLTKFIISMKMLPIIRLRTLNFSSGLIIDPFMQIGKQVKQKHESILEKAIYQLENGIAAKQGIIGTKNITKKIKINFTKKKNRFVDFVNKLTKPELLVNIAATNVEAPNIEKKSDLILKKLVQSVTKIFIQANSNLIKPVDEFAELDCKPKRCVKVSSAGRDDVYCLTVPDYGYFPLANGILASNCQDERQFDSAQGVEVHVLVIDEATQISERLIRTFRAWVRMSDDVKKTLLPEFKDKFPKIIYTANPVGVSVGFFRRHFVKAREAFKIEKIEGFLRQYIPSRATDNLSIDQEAHKGRLQGLGDPALAKALDEGDWDAPVGDFFPEFDETRHVISDFVPPSYWFRFRTFDWGTADPAVVHWWAVSDGESFKDHNDNLRWYPKGALIVYKEWYICDDIEPSKGARMRNEDMAEGILDRSLSKEEHKLITLTDSLPFQDRGGVTIAETFANKGVFLTLGDTSRITGWSQLRSRLIGVEIDSNDKKRTPMIYFTASCKYVRDYLPALPRHKTKTEDAAESGEATHVCDSLRLGAMARAKIAQIDPKPIDTKNLTNHITFDQALIRVKRHKEAANGVKW